MSSGTSPRHQQEEFLSLLDSDPQIAEEKYQRLRNKVISLCRHGGCFDPTDAADEAFGRAFEKWKKGELIESLPAFVRAIAKNVTYEKGRTLEVGELHEGLPAPRSVNADPEVVVFIEQCLRRLRPEDRHLIEAFFQGNKEKLESELAINRNTLSIRAHRLIKVLREFAHRERSK